MINIKNKKGVSDVITTVLIILLVLAAVAIIGGILLRNISQAGGKIETSTGCIELDVQPVSCSGLANTAPAGVGVRVLAQRGSRGSNLQISKLNAVVEKGDGTTVIGSSSTIPAALATANIDVTTNTITPRKSAALSATLQGSDGSDQTCELTNVKVDCKLGSAAKIDLKPNGDLDSIETPGTKYSVGAKIIFECGVTDAVLEISSLNAGGGITGFNKIASGTSCVSDNFV